jgi:hypothetical protein
MSEATDRHNTSDDRQLTILAYQPNTLHGVKRDHHVFGKRNDIPNPYGRMRIYLLGFSDMTVKVGITDFPRDRFRNIVTSRRTAGIISVLEMIAVSRPHINAKENETRFLREAGVKRPHGEYLRMDFTVACDILNQYVFRTEQTPDEQANDRRSEAFFGWLSMGATVR